MNINFYENEAGKDYLTVDILKDAPTDDIEQVVFMIKNLEKYGLSQLLKTKDAKPFKGRHTKLNNKVKLYELLVRAPNSIYRLPFFVVDNQIWILGGFKKKSQKTRMRHLKTFKRRGEACILKHNL